MEESFEKTNTSPVQYTSEAHNNSIITSSTPSLSIISDDHSIIMSNEHHTTLSSRDANKEKIANQYSRPPAVVPSLVDPVLHNKLSRYLNGSFDSTMGYTTTDVTSDTDSIEKHPLVKNTHKMTQRVNNNEQVPDKRTTQVMTHKGTQGVTYKKTEESTELDNLWKQFVASPLYTDWVKCKRSSDTKTAAMCYCEELKQLEYNSKHRAKLPVKKPQAVTHREHTTCDHSGTTINTSDYTSHTSDIGVQTSPSLLRATKSTDTSDALLTDCPCVSSHVIKGSPPSSDSSFDDQGSHDLARSHEQPASPTELSLQEACHLFKRDFISNCRHRQRMIHRTRKQREEELVTKRHQTVLADLAREYKKSQHTPGEYI